MAKQSLGNPPAGSPDLRDLEHRLGHHFTQAALLERALTHSSFAHEVGVSGQRGLPPRDYEGLEFLGDAILDFVVSEFLFRTYPSRSEGELSKMRAFLVSANHLSTISQKLDLGAFSRLSHGEEKTGGRMKKAILADLFESVVAAIHLDGGLEPARRFILKQFGPSLTRIAEKRLDFRDYKSLLQEELHKRRLPEPSYRVINEFGPDHEKEFVVELHVQDQFLARASGRSKKEAQQKAAEQAVEGLNAER